MFIKHRRRWAGGRAGRHWQQPAPQGWMVDGSMVGKALKIVISGMHAFVHNVDLCMPNK